MCRRRGGNLSREEERNGWWQEVKIMNELEVKGGMPEDDRWNGRWQKGQKDGGKIEGIQCLYWVSWKITIN